MVKRGIMEFTNRLKCIYSTNSDQIGQVVAIEEKEANSGIVKTMFLEVPAAGFVIYEGY